MRKLVFWTIIFILFSNIVIGATINGVIYDYSLNIVGNAVVVIDTLPEQKYITKNGSYTLNVPKGDYLISASEIEGDTLISYAEQEVKIIDSGVYNVDLILFPSLNEENELINEDLGELVTIEKTKENLNLLAILIIILLVIVLIFSAYFIFFRKHKVEIQDVSLEKLKKIIKESGGRTTQKEIRSKIPLSEAKISLMIAELEEKGEIKKIKKGRGNIVILLK